MSRTLILTMHWSDEVSPDPVCEAMAPLKAADTAGWAAAFDEETGAEVWEILTGSEDVEERRGV